MDEIFKECINIAHCSGCGFLTTIDGDVPVARPVEIFSKNRKALASVNELYFNTRLQARKVKQLENNPNVSILCYDMASHSYVRFSGTASRLPHSQAIGFWNEAKDKIWFRGGPNGRPIFLIHRVTLTQIDILSPKLVKLFGENEQFPEDPCTSTPVVLKRDKQSNNQWYMSHPVISNQKLTNSKL